MSRLHRSSRSYPSKDASAATPVQLLRRMWMTRTHSGSRSSRSTLCTAAVSADEDDTSSSFLLLNSPVLIRSSVGSLDVLPDEIELIFGTSAAEGLAEGREEEKEHVDTPTCSTTAETNTRSTSSATEKRTAMSRSRSLSTTRVSTIWQQHQRRLSYPKQNLAQEDNSQAVQHFDQAIADISSHRWDSALEQVKQGLLLLNDDNNNNNNDDNDSHHSPLYWKLQTVQAEVLGRRGDYTQSLATYQRVLHYAVSVSSDPNNNDASPELVASISSLYYACGRLAVYLRDYTKAVEYYTQELVHTHAIFGDSLAVARIYHEIAGVYKHGLGDWEAALSYYQQALRVEVAVWKRAKEAYGGSSVETKIGKLDRSVDDAERQQRLDDLHEAATQIQETKKCMGRIEFAMGRIEQAMQLSSELSSGQISMN